MYTEALLENTTTNAAILDRILEESIKDACLDGGKEVVNAFKEYVNVLEHADPASITRFESDSGLIDFMYPYLEHSSSIYCRYLIPHIVIQEKLEKKIDDTIEKGLKKTNDYYNKNSEVLKGIGKAEDYYNKNSEVLKGAKKAGEYYKKNSEVLKGAKKAGEYYKKNSPVLKGAKKAGKYYVKNSPVLKGLGITEARGYDPNRSQIEAEMRKEEERFGTSMDKGNDKSAKAHTKDNIKAKKAKRKETWENLKGKVKNFGKKIGKAATTAGDVGSFVGKSAKKGIAAAASGLAKHGKNLGQKAKDAAAPKIDKLKAGAKSKFGATKESFKKKASDVGSDFKQHQKNRKTAKLWKSTAKKMKFKPAMA